MTTPADIQDRLDRLCKPPGSLGRLERVAADLARIQRTPRPDTRPRRAVVFAADHGVASPRVTAWPPAVTTLMMDAIRQGVAASSVFARTFAVELELVDAGTHRSTEFAVSADLSVTDALSIAEFTASTDLGRRHARAAHADGIRVVVVGELGIGNTTPASCVVALLTGADPAEVTGRGAGADDATLLSKQQVVADAVARAKSRHPVGSVESIAAVAGRDLAALAGFMAESAELGLTVVLDGFVTTAALLIAERTAPGTRDAVVASHAGAEPGHRVALEQLRLNPVLGDWQLRLGEATGGLLCVPMLDAAAAMARDMATLDDLGAAPA